MTLLIIDEHTKDWKEVSQEEKKKMSEEEQKKVLYVDEFHRKKLDFIRDEQNLKNRDSVGLICGQVGSGKSTKGANDLRYISKDRFDPDKHMIGSDYDDAIEKIEKVPKGEWLLFDEGSVFFKSVDVMTKESKSLADIFDIFRQKNLVVMICMPSFFRVNPTLAIERSHFLVRTYVLTKKGHKDSFRFKYYGRKKKEILYNVGKKERNYNVVRTTIKGHFTPCYLIENEEYKEFKLQTLYNSIRKAKRKSSTSSKKTLSSKDIEMSVIRNIVANNPDKSSIELGKIIGKDDSRVRQIRADLKKEQIHAFKDLKRQDKGGVV